MLLVVQVLPVLQLEAKGWARSPQAVLHHIPLWVFFHFWESMQRFVPACRGCWGLQGDPSGLELGFGAHSIAAYVEATGLPNLLPPILLDVSQGWESWGDTQPATLDLLVSINMMHIAELRCTQGLFKGAGVLLKPGALRRGWPDQPPEQRGLRPQPEAEVDMPANNKSLIFRKL
ncbi:methyltransferase-like 26 isoform X9 [Pyrgilauda ruficollis]|uniref:methyltransferase-like 26 isoform X9 n=1 Tax=Pyrgilauda ruficollis TaxID=221976 RepID=UPI001B874F5A|nr:methyltransferase-like 26 isoform X9 [Pyrgilauda ruficollis]